MKAGANDEGKTLFVEKKADYDLSEKIGDKIELSYNEAIEVMAIWWEEMARDGVNVASEIQKARAKVRE